MGYKTTLSHFENSTIIENCQSLEIDKLPYLPGTQVPTSFEFIRTNANTFRVTMTYNANGFEFEAKDYGSVSLGFICQVV